MEYRFRLPDTLASSGDPVDGNPFRVQSVLHEVWKEATLKAEEEICRVNSDSMSLLTPENALDWLPTLVTAKFDVWAKRNIQVVKSDAAVQHYDQWLLGYANSWIDEVSRLF